MKVEDKGDGCTDCDGTGRISSEEYPGLGSIPCKECDGTGNTPDDFQGHLQTPKDPLLSIWVQQIRVEVPRG